MKRKITVCFERRHSLSCEIVIFHLSKAVFGRYNNKISHFEKQRGVPMKILPKIKKIQCRCNAFITRTVEKSQYFSETEYFHFLFLLLGTAVFFDIFQFFEILCRDYFQSGEICVYVCSEYSVKSTGYYAGV